MIDFCTQFHEGGFLQTDQYNLCRLTFGTNEKWQAKSLLSVPHKKYNKNDGYSRVGNQLQLFWLTLRSRTAQCISF